MAVERFVGLAWREGGVMEVQGLRQVRARAKGDASALVPAAEATRYWACPTAEGG